MKKFKNYFLLFLALSFGFVACSDDDDDDEPAMTTTPPPSNQPTQNIAEIAIASEGVTDSLVVALTQAGLVPTFQAAGTYTVFAPNNQAFVDLLATDPAWNAIADIPNATLTAVLQYHVLGTVVRSGDLTDDTYGVTLNQGAPNNENTVVEVDVTGGVRLNNDANNTGANVTQADIEATNGVIHIIDKVIMPQNVVGLAVNDERFSLLVQAVLRASLEGTLSGTGPFTVFAPTDAAFQTFLNDNNFASIDSIPLATLTTVLQYHVLNGNTQSKDLSSVEGVQIPTLSAQDSLSIDLSSGAVINTNSNQTVNIIVTDVQGSNGVIHAIDEVLFPN